MKGRRPKNNEQHIADGTFNVTKHRSRISVSVVSSDPPPPAHFDELHVQKWKWICARLRDADILTNADTEAMRIFCEAAATSETEYSEMQKEGTVIEGRKNPRRMVYDQAVLTMRQMFDQFGLTPLARLRLKSPEKPPEAGDPLDFLN